MKRLFLTVAKGEKLICTKCKMELGYMETVFFIRQGMMLLPICRGCSDVRQ
jgi:hypothetical protein